MTLSHHVEVDAARFRKELLFVCCKSDDPTTDRVRQLHEYVESSLCQRCNRAEPLTSLPLA